MNLPLLRTGPRPLTPIGRPDGVDPRRIARVSALAALAIVGRVAFVWAPNFALTYFVVFLAGALDGRKAGAAVGLIAMTVTNLLYSGLHPVLLANGLAMATLGILGGSVRQWVAHAPTDRLDRVLQVTLLTACGLFGTLLFSLTSDVVSYLTAFVLTPEGAAIGTRAFWPLILMGLAFNLWPAVANALLFAGLTPALLHALRRAGLAAPDGTPVVAAAP